MSAPRGKFLLMLFTRLEAQGRGCSWAGAEGLGNSRLPDPGWEGPRHQKDVTVWAWDTAESRGSSKYSIEALCWCFLTYPRPLTRDMQAHVT